MGEFGGVVVSRRRIARGWLSETVHTPGSAMGRHAHPAASLCLVSRGAFLEEGGAGEVIYRAGDVIFRPAGAEHRDRFLEQGARCFNLELTLPPGLGAELTGWSVIPPATRRLLGRLRAEHLRNRPSPLVLEGLICQIAGEILERDEAGPPRPQGWLISVREEIDLCFGEPLTLARLAARAGVHPGHLSRAFRHAWNKTVAGYIREVRLRRAQDMMRRGDRSIAQIALATGFADQSHLTRVFRRLTGTTPACYRKRALARHHGRDRRT